jgi:hypothetical protein
MFNTTRHYLECGDDVMIAGWTVWVVKEVFVQQKSKVLNMTLSLQDSDNEKKN